MDVVLHDPRRRGARRDGCDLSPTRLGITLVVGSGSWHAVQRLGSARAAGGLEGLGPQSLLRRGAAPQAQMKQAATA